MHSPVTEVATITFKPGADLSSPSTPASKAWSETLSTVSQQAGYQRAYWGHQLENPNIVLLLIDWDSLAAHEKFMNDPSYTPFVNRITPFVEEGGLHLHHFTSNIFPPRIFGQAPVIEFATAYNTEPVFIGNVEKFVGAVDKGSPDGYKGAVFGGVIEEIAKGGSEEGKGKAVRLCIGWMSKEAHMEFRETQLFKDNISLLREGVGSMEVFHVKFQVV